MKLPLDEPSPRLGASFHVKRRTGFAVANLLSSSVLKNQTASDRIDFAGSPRYLTVA